MWDIIDISLQCFTTIFNNISLFTSHDIHKWLRIELHTGTGKWHWWVMWWQLFMKSAKHLVLTIHMPFLISNLYWKYILSVWLLSWNILTDQCLCDDHIDVHTHKVVDLILISWLTGWAMKSELLYWEEALTIRALHRHSLFVQFLYLFKLFDPTLKLSILFHQLWNCWTQVFVCFSVTTGLTSQ